MHQLFQILTSIAPISSEFQDFLQHALRTKHYSKREFLLQSGHVCSKIWFIETGLVRCFYNVDDKDVCSWFMKEMDVIISVKSFFKQEPSAENIQALEDTIVHYISFEDLQFLYQRYPEFNVHGRILTEKYYVLSEERLQNMRMKSTTERYLTLLKAAPELLLRVSNADIASYLGMTMETLSRIKSQVYNNKSSI